MQGNYECSWSHNYIPRVSSVLQRFYVCTSLLITACLFSSWQKESVNCLPSVNKVSHQVGSICLYSLYEALVRKTLYIQCSTPELTIVSFLKLVVPLKCLVHLFTFGPFKGTCKRNYRRFVCDQWRVSGSWRWATPLFWLKCWSLDSVAGESVTRFTSVDRAAYM